MERKPRLAPIAETTRLVRTAATRRDAMGVLRAFVAPGAVLGLTGLLLLSWCGGDHEKRLPGAPGRFAIAGDRDAVEIPFELYGGTKPLIRGTMNGRQVAFLIDNGKLFDPVWFYDGEVDSIDVRFTSGGRDTLAGLGAEGSSEIRRGEDVNITFGDLRFANQPTLISPCEAGFGAYFPGVNGQVSSLLFKHFVVTFDFERNVMTLTRPDKFEPRGKGTCIPMWEGGNGSYCVPFSLCMGGTDTRIVLLDIDIGTIFPLYLVESAANRIRVPTRSPRRLIGYGASGAIFGRQGRVAAVCLGEYTLKDVPAEFVEKCSNADTAVVAAGTFGLPLMRRFTITFDYFNRVVYLEPNKSFDAAFE